MDIFLIIAFILVFLILIILITKRIKRKSKLEQEFSESVKSTEEITAENDCSQQIADDLTARNFPEEFIEVVDKVAAIPKDFHELGNKSMYQLVIDSGYVDKHEQITNEIITYVLTQKPYRIMEWVQWSEDQRVSEGWFLREDNKIWSIGAFSTKDAYKESLTPFPDLRSACADFIKLELEYTRKLIEEDQNKKKKKKGKHQ
jgi:hypothetical protein